MYQVSHTIAVNLTHSPDNALSLRRGLLLSTICSIDKRLHQDIFSLGNQSVHHILTNLSSTVFLLKLSFDGLVSSFTCQKHSRRHTSVRRKAKARLFIGAQVRLFR